VAVRKRRKNSQDGAGNGSFLLLIKSEVKKRGYFSNRRLRSISGLIIAQAVIFASPAVVFCAKM
jgi:hypothetical protein